MSFTKGLVLVLVSTLLVASGLLAIARLPGGDPVAIGLSQAAQRWAGQDFEKALRREVASLQDPQTEPLLRQLVILQIVENARRQRVELLRDPFYRGWQVPLPAVAADSTGPGTPGPAVGNLPLVTGTADDRGANGGGNDTLLGALVLLFLSLSLMIIRRP